MAPESDPFANDPFGDDPFADPFGDDPSTDDPGHSEWLAGTAWRDAFELPLDDVVEPLVLDEPDPTGSAPWEVDG